MSFSQFTNPNKARIKELEMTAGKYGDAFLTVDWVTPTNTRVSIHFSEVEFAAVREEFHNIVDGLRHGLFSWMRRWGAPAMIAVMLVAIIGVGFAVSYYRLSQLDDEVATFSDYVAGWSIFLMALALAMWIPLLHCLLAGPHIP